MRNEKSNKDSATESVMETQELPVAEPAAPAPPAPAAPAVKKTVEAWATAKGMLPQFFEPEMPVIPPHLMNLPAVGISMKAIPTRRHNSKHAEYVGARALRGWPIGKEVTEAEFDEAALHAMNQPTA